MGSRVFGDHVGVHENCGRVRVEGVPGDCEVRGHVGVPDDVEIGRGSVDIDPDPKTRVYRIDDNIRVRTDERSLVRILKDQVAVRGHIYYEGRFF